MGITTSEYEYMGKNIEIQTLYALMRREHQQNERRIYEQSRSTIEQNQRTSQGGRD